MDHFSPPFGRIFSNLSNHQTSKSKVKWPTNAYNYLEDPMTGPRKWLITRVFLVTSPIPGGCGVSPSKWPKFMILWLLFLGGYNQTAYESWNDPPRRASSNRLGLIMFPTFPRCLHRNSKNPTVFFCSEKTWKNKSCFFFWGGSFKGSFIVSNVGKYNFHSIQATIYGTYMTYIHHPVTNWIFF